MHEGENYSVEHLRRALNIGYKKAKRIFDEMEGKMAKTSTDDDYTGKAAPTPKVPHFLFPQLSRRSIAGLNLRSCRREEGNRHQMESRLRPLHRQLTHLETTME